MMRLALAVCSGAALVLSGCARFAVTEGQRYETVTADPHRKTELAIRKNEQALHFIAHNKWEAAEKHLEAALVADVDYGPAHNNLGWVYYKQGRFYLAAWEFEYAAQLMPASGDPLNNLGLVMEAADRVVEAISYYEQATGLDPRRAEFLANLARAHVRSETVTPDAAALLHEVALRDERPDWREWARQLLATRYQEVHLACCVGVDPIWGHGPANDFMEAPEGTERPELEFPVPSLNSSPHLETPAATDSAEESLSPDTSPRF